MVHENHGLGIYQGIEKIQVDKVAKDYMKISYAQGGNLYIPATQLDLIQKYAGSDAKKPKLNRLGTQEWTKTKTRVRVARYERSPKIWWNSMRQGRTRKGMLTGRIRSGRRNLRKCSPLRRQRISCLAIEAVKRDMQSRRIMDRLICGDVGYGKTEIAIRAAFKAVQEDKQVVYLGAHHHSWPSSITIPSFSG